VAGCGNGALSAALYLGRNKKMTCCGQAILFPFQILQCTSLGTSRPRSIKSCGALSWALEVVLPPRASQSRDQDFDVCRRIMEIDFFAPIRLTQPLLPADGGAPGGPDRRGQFRRRQGWAFLRTSSSWRSSPSAQGANSTASDSFGQFTLQFPHKRIGEAV
jgi:hypothetical protein